LIEVAELEPGYNTDKNVVDAGRVHFPLRVRNWQPGDAYQPVGSSRSKKLKELFQRGRVPAGARRGYPVVLSGNEIVWVPGFGPAAGYAVTRTSRRALWLKEENGSL
jgi:tRNA(Ile)-lysidine synthase